VRRANAGSNGRSARLRTRRRHARWSSIAATAPIDVERHGRHAPGEPSGDIDKDFAMMMKMHHQQAVDMAKAEAEHGKSPELKAMARKIIKDQNKEIAQLDKWMKGRK
jgi:uncharacterized protein (DUF305 family)